MTFLILFLVLLAFFAFVLAIATALIDSLFSDEHPTKDEAKAVMELWPQAERDIEVMASRNGSQGVRR